MHLYYIDVTVQLKLLNYTLTTTIAEQESLLSSIRECDSSDFSLFHVHVVNDVRLRDIPNQRVC